MVSLVNDVLFEKFAKLKNFHNSRNLSVKTHDNMTELGGFKNTIHNRNNFIQMVF